VQLVAVGSHLSSDRYSIWVALPRLSSAGVVGSVWERIQVSRCGWIDLALRSVVARGSANLVWLVSDRAVRSPRHHERRCKWCVAQAQIRCSSAAGPSRGGCGGIGARRLRTGAKAAGGGRVSGATVHRRGVCKDTTLRTRWDFCSRAVRAPVGPIRPSDGAIGRAWATEPDFSQRSERHRYVSPHIAIRSRQINPSFICRMVSSLFQRTSAT